jgi:phosphoribosylformylglycinamidine synthase
LLTGKDEGEVPALDFEREKNLHAFLLEAASQKLLASAHDCSEGGLAVALAESALQGNQGVTLDWADDVSPAAALFGESQSRAVISLAPGRREEMENLLTKHQLPHLCLGRTGGGDLAIRYNGGPVIQCPLDELSRLWDTALEAIMN